MQETVKQDREKYIGGSDIPVIMNLSPFKSRYHLLLEKAGYREDKFEGNIYTEYGNTLEPKIRNYINNTFCTNDAGFIEGKHVREASGDEIIGVRIHTDGENEDTILEIKTTPTIYENLEDYKFYLVQILFYMLVADKKKGILAVYERPEDLSEELDPKRLQIFTFERESFNDLINQMAEDIERFIEDLKLVKENPTITEEDLNPIDVTEIAQRIRAYEDQLVYYEDTLRKLAKEKARLKNAMEAASVKSWITQDGYKISLNSEGDIMINKQSEG